MNKEDIINYVMTTPSNPNRAVLEGMLEEASEGGGSINEVNVVFLPNGMQADTQYTGTELLAMAKDPNVNLIVTKNDGDRQSKAICIEEAKNDFGASIGCALIFVEKPSNLVYAVREYQVLNDGQSIGLGRTLSTE